MQTLAAYLAFMLVVMALGLSVICIGVCSIALYEGASVVWSRLHCDGGANQLWVTAESGLEKNCALAGRKENRMKENVVANATREEVHNASRLLVEVLNERKEMGLELLKEETGMESDILSWAIGWLVRDDMVEVIPNGGSYSVRRKEPDTSKPILI